jgi:predicted amidophosphoribosyltransferase
MRQMKQTQRHRCNAAALCLSLSLSPVSLCETCWKTVTAASECGERLSYADKTNNDPASERCSISTIKSIIIEAVFWSALRMHGEGSGR